MLSPRYENDGKALLNLSPLQLTMKQQVEQKVRDGRYKFEKNPCPVCDGNSFEFLSMKDRYGLYMPVVICRDCGLIQTNPRMNEDSYKDFYNIEYRKLYVGEENPTDKFFQSQVHKGHRIFNYLQANGLLKRHENFFVFEVGCGAGGILYYFKKMGCCVKGIDLGESYIEFGRNHYNLDISVGTINNFELEKTPDLIIYSHVLEHILTPNDELQRIYNILSDTGLLYIEIPGVKNLMRGYKMDFLRLLQNAHVYHFTLTSLKNLLLKNNFVFILGNETVNSVFRRSQDRKFSAEIKNDYLDVMGYLQKSLILKYLYLISPYNIKISSKSLISTILKKLGLFKTVKYLYHMIINRKTNYDNFCTHR